MDVKRIETEFLFFFYFMLDRVALDGLMVSASLSTLAKLTLSSFLLSGIQCI